MASEPGYCGHCGDTAIMTCFRCRDISYCSVECLEADDRLHQLLCYQVAAYQDRPSLEMRRAILLPVNGTQPTFTWIPTEGDDKSDDGSDCGDECSDNELEYDEEVAVLEFDPKAKVAYPDPRNAIGEESLCVRTAEVVLGKIGSGQHLDHGIIIAYDDEFAINGSAVNRCLELLTRGRSRRFWRGNLLIYGMNKALESTSCQDLGASDLTIAIEGILQYTHKLIEGLSYFLRPKPAQKVKGVLIHPTSPLFEEVDVPRQHPIFTSGQPSEITT